MKNSIGMLLFIAVLSFNVKAAPETERFVSIYSVSTNCSTCVNQPEDDNVTAVAGINFWYVGIDMFKINQDIGLSFYAQFKPTENLRLFAGVVDMPDVANVDVPTYGIHTHEKHGAGLVVGATYKIFSIRYNMYDVEHSVTRSTTTGTGVFDSDGFELTEQTNVQTGTHKNKKQSLWVGITHEF